MNIKRWLSASFIIITVIAVLGLIKFNQIQAAIAFGESFPEPSAAVKSTYVTTTEHQQSVKVIGQLHARQTITISNEYPGSITYVGFVPGEKVGAGQVLIKLDTSIDEADLKAAKARVQLAESTYQRFKKLLAEKRISPDEVDRAAAEVAVNQAQVQRLTALIEKKTIRAPFAGQTGLDQYQSGQFLDANSAITTLVGSDDAIWVDFQVPQTLPQPQLGDKVSVRVAGSNNPVDAQVIAKNAALDMGSRQQGYRALLANPEAQFSHNQMASVFVPTKTVKAAVVPSNAITRNHFGEFVYLLKKDEQQNWRAQPVKVTLGEKVEDQQLVLSGLSGGEFIATEGAFKLQENLLVYIEQTAAAGQQSEAQ